MESYLYDPQVSWFDHVDLICKTENLYTDFTIVKEKLGQSVELRKYNWTKKQHKVSEYYSNWSWGFVYETYKEDFETRLLKVWSWKVPMYRLVPIQDPIERY